MARRVEVMLPQSNPPSVLPIPHKKKKVLSKNTPIIISYILLQLIFYFILKISCAKFKVLFILQPYKNFLKKIYLDNYSCHIVVTIVLSYLKIFATIRKTFSLSNLMKK